MLVGLIGTLAIIEVLVRDEVMWRALSAVLAMAFAFALPWRRVLPLQMVILVFGANTVVRCYALLNNIDWTGLYTTVLVLILPYALLRWGSGKEACLGLGFIMLTFVTTLAIEQPPVGEIVGASLFILFPSALGASVRYQDAAQQRASEQVRLREREQLARELHDTVGHYVSAIAVQAQAGRALATTRPEAPLEALAVIENAASQALGEMRSILRALRGDDEAAYSPAASLADIERLANDTTFPFRIEVSTPGSLDKLDTALASTLFRLTQESITNAVRHARNASRLDVRITGDDKQVNLIIADDGEQVTNPAPPGLGLQGMTERVALLGGSLTAGPGIERGWVVKATLPMGGEAS